MAPACARRSAPPALAQRSPPSGRHLSLSWSECARRRPRTQVSALLPQRTAAQCAALADVPGVRVRAAPRPASPTRQLRSAVAQLFASPVLPAELRGAAALRLRGLASQPDEVAASTVQSLKSLLRRLYLKVHPDLLADAPQEQATNQRSFVLLREYFSLLESDA
jgi:hypothetical protein